MLLNAGYFLKMSLYLLDAPVEKHRADFFFVLSPFLLLTPYFQYCDAYLSSEKCMNYYALLQQRNVCHKDNLGVKCDGLQNPVETNVTLLCLATWMQLGWASAGLGGCRGCRHGARTRSPLHHGAVGSSLHGWDMHLQLFCEISSCKVLSHCLAWRAWCKRHVLVSTVKAERIFYWLALNNREMRTESKFPVLLLVPSGDCDRVPKHSHFETKYL